MTKRPPRRGTLAEERPRLMMKEQQSPQSVAFVGSSGSGSGQLHYMLSFSGGAILNDFLD